MVTRISGWPALSAVGALVVGVAAVAPEPVVLGTVRLAALAVAVAGVSLLIVRAGAADLATAAAMAAGAYAGGVGTALLGVPVAAGLPVGALAGAVVGTAAGAMHGRVGRTLGALTSLALGLGLVAVLGAWPAGGGVAGFHAVGLPTRLGDRADLVAVGLALALALAVAHVVARSGMGRAASVAVRAPVVAAAFGRSPAADGARLGAVAGALVGAGGVTLAAVDGSVLPGAYGLGLAAALALAAAIGGAAPLGPVVGALVVWGPGTLWPLVPLVGTAPPLLVMGPVGLAVLALRRGRPFLPGRDATPGGRGSDEHGSTPDGPLAPGRRARLDVTGAATPVGPVDLHAEPGEVVALVGPNGAGKSTLLARIGGQLPDGGSVRVSGSAVPGRPAARARAGIGRTWQRPPRIPPDDGLGLIVAADPARAASARWARQVLDPDHADATEDPGIAQLVRLAAAGPAIALLDEPTDVPPDRLAAYVRGLADAGSAVVVVDHRPEVAAAADRVVTIGTAAEAAADGGASEVSP